MHRAGWAGFQGGALAARAAAAAVFAFTALGLLGCGDNLEAPAGPDREYRAGGDTTVDNRASSAYSFPAPNLSPDQTERHLEGDVAFEATFVTGGAPVNNGLGPLYNNSSCGRCHGRDGRGMANIGEGATSQSLVRVSLPDGEPDVPGGSVGVPGFGTQVQNHAVYGRDPEAIVSVEWRELAGEYGDGTTYSLREPRLGLRLPDGGAVDAGILTSLRQPPSVFGLGLLEAIDAATLEAWADPDDSDGDGISGRINWVWDVDRRAAEVGRFGHKANQPNLLQQAAAAYANDIGVTNPIFPDDADGSEDIAMETVEVAAFYTRTLAVPGHAPLSPAGERGEELFEDLGCGGCHRSQAITGLHELAALSDQAIQPFTDLLLHDMGEGLADGRPDFMASGSEWRTAPLWGVGLVQTVQPGSGYLHDGRARTIAEAILWHGGEAEAAADGFRQASSDDRAALLAFLGSL
ncbi:MAG TPA: di-heme oxidoredictase family protein [Kofleriaceae bacterium]|nr:di-heme oxidoredictase family protein [Kofleriaceae bacterium]